MPSESFNTGRRLGIALLPGFAILIVMIALGVPGNQPMPLGQVMALLIAIIGLICLAFWLVQFVDLMASPTARFPGPYDKPIWAAIFIFLVPLAPFAFWTWKQTVERDQ